MDCVGVVDREAGAHQAVDVVDLRTADVGDAEVVDQDLDALVLDDQRRAEDVIVDHEGVQIVVDDFSVSYIRGAEIDYVDSLMGAGFTVHNPNAVHSCSCGHSFDTGEDASGAQACGCGH